MDPLRIHAYKIHATNKYKRQQFLNNVVLYTSTTLVCTLFCASPLWYPPLYATFNVFLFFSLPNITSLFFTPKVLFIIGNLIVIYLVGESKIFTSKASSSSSSPCDVYYNEHLARRRVPRKCEKKLEKKKVEELSLVEKASSSAFGDEGERGLVEKASTGTTENEGGRGYWVDKVREVEKVKRVELDLARRRVPRKCEKKLEKKKVEELSLVEKVSTSTIEDEGERGSIEKVSTSTTENEGGRGYWVDKVRKMEKVKKVELDLPAEEVNKLADDFIARVNRRRRLEAELFSRG